MFTSTKRREQNEMTTTVKCIDNSNGITWYEVSGTDYGTDYEFEGSESFGVTDDQVLDCDGCPLTEGDSITIAVRNAISKSHP